MKKFYLTTPIYYPNARPHVGSAYTTIVCDVIARYKRMGGYGVAFLTGTDEHGEKLQRAAEQAGKSPAEFVASKRELFRTLWRFLNIGDYRFVHTSQNPEHVRSVQWMLRRADENGFIEKKNYEGRYCVSDERYISDGPEPADCDICGRPAELISEQNYFFKLSAFQDRLLDLYEKHPEFVLPDFRRNEVLSFVRSGLRDISVSRRRIKWGIPWPDDPEQVFYVWYDALTSYMTGAGFGSEDAARRAEFKTYWPADLHMIGKDILRFHAVYWPAFLMAAEMPLPATIFAHGWIYYEQDKMSKSKGNVVYPEPIVEAFGSFGAPGNDALRYYLLRETPFGQDMSFSYESLIQRYNSDLANDLGNLASRTVTMIHRYCGGEVPRPQMGLTGAEEMLRAAFFGELTKDGEITLTARGGLTSEYTTSFDAFDLGIALAGAWQMISALNKYLVEQQPWKLAGSDRQEDRPLLELVLYTAADLLRTITILLGPVIPDSSERLWKQLGGSGALADQRVADLKWAALQPGTKVGKAEPIFPRLDRAAALARLEEFAQADRQHDKPKEKSSTMQTDSGKPPETAAVPSAPSAAPGPGAGKISIEDFAKVEMRTGEIRSAEPVPGAQKLLKLMVDIGTEVRQVVAGIAGHYRPEEIVGMKIVVVTNLQPRKLRGVESNGMVVAATVGEEGRPVLATFKEDVPNGSRLK